MPENCFTVRYVSKGKPANKKRCGQTLRKSSEAEQGTERKARLGKST